MEKDLESEYLDFLEYLKSQPDKYIVTSKEEDRKLADSVAEPGSSRHNELLYLSWLKGDLQQILDGKMPLLYLIQKENIGKVLDRKDRHSDLCQGVEGRDRCC